MPPDHDPTERRLLEARLDAARDHVVAQFLALTPDDRRRTQVPSGWTPRGLVRHLTLDVERVWSRAVMAGEAVELPEGYDGWRAPDDVSDDDLLAGYADECREGRQAVAGLSLDAAPQWWFGDLADCPCASLREVLLHVLVETATHAGHLDVCRELSDGGQRLVLDVPEG